jgi:hypothetical protein
MLYYCQKLFGKKWVETGAGRPGAEQVAQTSWLTIRSVTNTTNALGNDVTVLFFTDSHFEKLYQQGLQLITRHKKKMKQKLVKLIDKILLRKRSLIETVNDQVKNISQIEHSRHRSIWNFFVNLFAGLIAYTYLPQKPSLDLGSKGKLALPPAVF